MTRFDAIVIGAGINGLIAGATLAKRGRSVCILEQRADLGGMATLAQDGGPALAHLLYNLSPRALQGIGLDPQSPLFTGPALRSVALSETGHHIILRGASAAMTDGTPHRDAAAVTALLERTQAYGGLLRRLAEASPPGGAPAFTSGSVKELLNLGVFGWGVKRLGKTEMRRFLQLLLSNAFDMILDEIPDGPLAGLLAADAVRGTAAGPRSPGTVFNLIYRMGHGGQIMQPQDGIASVTDEITKAAHAAGCQIETGATVTRIRTHKDAVAGVDLANGTSFDASEVFISSGPRTALDLVGTAHEDIETTRRIRTLRARGTTAKIHLRLDGPPSIPGLPDDLGPARLVFAPSAEYVETAFNPAKYGQMSDHPVIEAVPVKTGQTWWLSMIVQYAPSDLTGGWTSAARDQLAKTALATLARVAPDLPSTVQGQQVITPDQIEAATGAPGGHWHHAEMSLDQLLTLRPVAGLSRYAMGLKGLYLCGASSHPGGDVMGLAGRNAALAARS